MVIHWYRLYSVIYDGVSNWRIAVNGRLRGYHRLIRVAPKLRVLAISHLC